jgi:anti-sigma regulatory factor (Ser/Thr protein kinase)
VERVTTALLLDHTRTTRHVMRAGQPTALTPAVARAWLTRILTRAHLPADTAALVVSELATNAVLYAAAPLQIDAQIEGATLRLAVTDRPPAEPIASDLPGDEHGYGLGIVHSLCTGYDEAVRAGRHTVEVTIELETENER